MRREKKGNKMTIEEEEEEEYVFSVLTRTFRTPDQEEWEAFFELFSCFLSFFFRGETTRRKRNWTRLLTLGLLVPKIFPLQAHQWWWVFSSFFRHSLLLPEACVIFRRINFEKHPWKRSPSHYILPSLPPTKIWGFFGITPPPPLKRRTLLLLLLFHVIKFPYRSIPSSSSPPAISLKHPADGGEMCYME